MGVPWMDPSCPRMGNCIVCICLIIGVLLLQKLSMLELARELLCQHPVWGPMLRM